MKVTCKTNRVFSYFCKIRILVSICRNKLKKEETLYIGDAQTDLDAANTSQIDFILRRHKLNADLSNNFKGKIIDDLSL